MESASHVPADVPPVMQPATASAV